MENETTTWSEFTNEGKAIVKQILVWHKKINLKEQGWERHNLGSK